LPKPAALPDRSAGEDGQALSATGWGEFEELSMIRLSTSVAAVAVLGVALAAPAVAQDRYTDAAYQSAPDTVEVTAPRFHEDADGQRLNGPLEKVSLSTNVRYDDLDLSTRAGARELRFRVREAARDVCDQLAGAYQVYQLNGTSCFKTALENGLVRANSTIASERSYNRDAY
jgi:UrcA family protein